MTTYTDHGLAPELRKTIGLYGAVALALGIVLGGGMLSLPGLVYREAGGWAALSWIFDGVLVLPLLFVFAVLGRRFPNAGGVAGFVGEAFPGLKPGCSYLLVGTFSIGLPGIALTGSGYLASGLGLADIEGARWIIAGIAAFLMACVLAIAWLGGKFAGAVQNAVVTLLVGCLALISFWSVPHWEAIDFTVGDPTWFGVWSGMGLAFFAYTGWEMLSFTAEEFKNPRRDFPLAVAISFLLVIALYVGAAFSVQSVLDLNDPETITAPFLAVVEGMTGSGLGSLVLTIVVLAIITTNLNGASWAASRLLFDIGRGGWAPERLKLHQLHGAAATPRPAIMTLGLLFLGVFYLYGAGYLDLADLLRLAGQNFFLLYTLSIVAYLKIERRPPARVFGFASLAVCLVFAGVFGWGLVYAGVLFIAPYFPRWLGPAGIATSRHV